MSTASVTVEQIYRNRTGMMNMSLHTMGNSNELLVMLKCLQLVVGSLLTREMAQCKGVELGWDGRDVSLPMSSDC